MRNVRKMGSYRKENSRPLYHVGETPQFSWKIKSDIQIRVGESSVLLGHYTASIGNLLTTFQNNISVRLEVAE